MVVLYGVLLFIGIVFVLVGLGSMVAGNGIVMIFSFGLAFLFIWLGAPGFDGPDEATVVQHQLEAEGFNVTDVDTSDHQVTLETPKGCRLVVNYARTDGKESVTVKLGEQPLTTALAATLCP